MTTYAVTGASGHLGRLAVLELLARGVSAADVVAVVRTAGKAADLAKRGVPVREADYSRPETLGPALAGVDRLLLVSGSTPGQRVAQHANVIAAARTAGVSRIVYTSIINADDTTNPLAGEHQGTERALREAGVPCTVLRNGWYTENYTDQLDQYLQRGEIVGAAGRGLISAASRQDYAAAAAAALLESAGLPDAGLPDAGLPDAGLPDAGLPDTGGDRIYELGGPAFDLAELARVISEVTGVRVTYRDLSADKYESWLQETGLDEGTARFVAALDTSIAHGDLETSRQDLTRLLGRPPTPLADVVREGSASERSVKERSVKE